MIVYLIHLILYIRRAFDTITAEIQRDYDAGQSEARVFLADFHLLLRRLPGILFPYAFVVQKGIREHTLSRCRWLYISTVRRIFSRNKNLRADEFIQIVINECVHYTWM